jgi:hypothetical protein
VDFAHGGLSQPPKHRQDVELGIGGKGRLPFWCFHARIVLRQKTYVNDLNRILRSGLFRRAIRPLRRAMASSRLRRRPRGTSPVEIPPAADIETRESRRPGRAPAPRAIPPPPARPNTTTISARVCAIHARHIVEFRVCEAGAQRLHAHRRPGPAQFHPDAFGKRVDPAFARAVAHRSGAGEKAGHRRDVDHRRRLRRATIPPSTAWVSRRVAITCSRCMPS